MQFKTRKNLTLFAAILLFATAFSSLSAVIYTVLLPDQALSMYIQEFEQINNANFVVEYKQLITALTIFFSVVDGFKFVISLGFAIFYTRYSKLNEQDFYKKQKFFITITVLNLLFVGNVVSAILAFMAIFSKSENKEKILKDYTETEKEMLEHIKELKVMHQNGLISDDEYHKKLFDIIK